MPDDETEEPGQFVSWQDLTRKLLKDIKTGRRRAKKNKALLAQYLDAVSQQEAAIRDQNEKLVHAPDQAPKAHRHLEKCMKRVSVLGKRRATAIAFIPTFQTELNQLLAWLPVSDEQLQIFGPRIHELHIGSPDAWLQVGANSALDVLKYRLTDMLDIDKKRSATPDEPVTPESDGTGSAQGITQSTPRTARRRRRRPNAIQSRAKIRLGWLKQQMESKGWTSDLDIAEHQGPVYNTIQVYRSGRITTRTPYVRRALSKAFGCKFSDVPE